MNQIMGPKLIMQTLNSYKNTEEQNVICMDDFSLKQLHLCNTSGTPLSLMSKASAKQSAKCSVKFNLNTVTCNYRIDGPVFEITRNVKKLIQSRPSLHWVNPAIKI